MNFLPGWCITHLSTLCLWCSTIDKTMSLLIILPKILNFTQKNLATTFSFNLAFYFHIVDATSLYVFVEFEVFCFKYKVIRQKYQITKAFNIFYQQQSKNSWDTFSSRSGTFFTQFILDNQKTELHSLSRVCILG